MNEPRLIAIPISHFCEKARWALERAEIEFVEERHMQGFHPFYTRRAGGRFTTPVLVLPDGRVLRQSRDILAWADQSLPEERRLYPAETAPRVRAVERWLDTTLGPDGRRWMYSFMLYEKELAGSYGTEGAPAHEVRAFKRLFEVVRPMIQLRVSLNGASTDIQRVYDVFDAAAAMLEDGGHLVGDRFTAADLTFTALSAAVLIPDRYGVKLPPVELLPAEMRGHVEALREHPAGRHAARMIAEQRGAALSPAASPSG